MQYNKRTNKDITENFLINLLLDRGILPTDSSDVEKFVYPKIINEIPPILLDNMKEGYELLMKHLHGSKILLVVD